ncbi:MAG: type II toxin-antitoxin system VapC family toxin [Spirochaetaceae bacterium]|jgi:predicted nucleic acid-binding protein|nr:type II toxin-antitoxin system VapC family toxin [Spirochaetaceae bacterium]
MKQDNSLVIDASAIMGILLDEPAKASIVKSAEGCDISAPSIMPFEVANALSREIRRNRITVEQSREAFRIYKTIPINKVKINYESTLEICYAQKTYAYDAAYIDLALRLRAPLLTLDDNMRRIAKSLNIYLVLED